MFKMTTMSPLHSNLITATTPTTIIAATSIIRSCHACNLVALIAIHYVIQTIYVYHIVICGVDMLLAQLLPLVLLPNKVLQINVQITLFMTYL